jgi:hypothetical protein
MRFKLVVLVLVVVIFVNRQTLEPQALAVLNQVLEFVAHVVGTPFRSIESS